VNFPGGAKKFTIRRDLRTGRYWTISSAPKKEKVGTLRPGGVRNRLVLACSSDLQTWEERQELLYHPDISKHGFQYVDWQFGGEDLIAVCRTAFDDDEGGANNNHDANYLTFHRIPSFRAER
jgi:hypothetical protein